MKKIMTENTGEKAMITKLGDAIEQTALKEANITIGAGVSGCNAFQQHGEQNEVRVLLTWQWLDALENIANDVILVVPQHAINEKFDALKAKGVKIITISGVLHTTTLEQIQSESTAAIDPQTKGIVMLAGDTQQENGEWKLYDRNMLQELLKNLPQDQKILILNGPRTGKHIENTTELDTTAHRTTIDHITQYVIDNNPGNWQVIDFKYGEKSQWLPGMKFLIDNKLVWLILPGESTSMISEALSFGIKALILQHSAMTPTSVNYIKQLLEEGKIYIYPADDIYYPENHNPYRQEQVPDQVDKIVSELSAFTTGQSNNEGEVETMGSDGDSGGDGCSGE